MSDGKTDVEFERSRDIKGLKKELKELTTLCDVEANMIIYGPKLDEEPETWPSDPRVINRLIENYEKQSDNDRRRRTMDMINFLEKKRKKLEQTLANMKKLKYPKWDEQFNEYSTEELKEFHDGLEDKIKNAKKKIEFMEALLDKSLIMEEQSPSN